MISTSYILGIAASLLSLIVVIELLRRRHLRERHAIWWFVASLLALTVSVLPSTLTWAADLMGITLPINLVFFASIAVLFFVCLQHSSELTRLESNTRTLAEIVALSELRVNQLEARLDSDGSTTERPPHQ
jgi:hypothetical protein